MSSAVPVLVFAVPSHRLDPQFKMTQQRRRINMDENEGFSVGQRIEIHSFPPGHNLEDWNGCTAEIHRIKVEERKLTLVCIDFSGGQSWYSDVSFDHCSPLL
jgi:hypothetical protein